MSCIYWLLSPHGNASEVKESIEVACVRIVYFCSVTLGSLQFCIIVLGRSYASLEEGRRLPVVSEVDNEIETAARRRSWGHIGLSTNRFLWEIHVAVFGSSRLQPCWLGYSPHAAYLLLFRIFQGRTIVRGSLFAFPVDSLWLISSIRDRRKQFTV